MKYSSKIILKSVTGLRDVVYFFFSILFSSGGQLVQRSENVLATLVKEHKRNISVKLI